MKKYLNKYIVAAVFAGMMGLTGCEKDFLDVNTNPNTPLSSTPNLILPSGTLALAYTMGNQFQFLGNFWAQHWTQSYAANQYKELDKYQVTTASYDRPWLYLYSTTLSDYKYISDNVSADSVNYGAIADIMSAYTYQVLVDAWDQVPYSEALQGAANLNPHYEAGDVIYTDLIKRIDAGVARISANSAKIGSEDLVFQGNMEKWRKFANTLKLKIYLRQVYARPAVAEAGIRQLYSEGAQFLAGNEEAEIKFTDATNNRNPVFQTEFTFSKGVNVVASESIINYLLSTNDPRIDDFFDKAISAPNTGNHKGIPQGAAGVPNAPSTATGAFSRPDAVNIVGPSSAVPFISGAESLFLQAEAALRYGVGDPVALYNDGIRASFGRWNRAVPATFLAQPTIDLNQASTLEDKVNRIITQKWVSMSGRQGFEAWTEVRRTGYPSFIQPSASSTLGAGRFGNRIPFVTSELTRNPNAPGVVDVYVPVWWDKK